MDNTYWHKQGSEPLFSDLEWNKPERRNQAGKLLIIGGNLHALNAPARAYELARQHGIGKATIALPDKTKRLVGHTLPEAIFLPSTPSGEFSQEGEQQITETALWADTVLLPGDIGRNSQTTIVLESLLRIFTGTIVLTKDALESLGNYPDQLFNSPNAVLVASFSQLQRLIKNGGFLEPLQFSMDLVKLVDYLHNFTRQCHARIVTVHHDQLIVAVNGSISSTKLTSDQSDPKRWRLAYAAAAACYITWYPEKAFEALTHSAYLLEQGSGT